MCWWTMDVGMYGAAEMAEGGREEMIGAVTTAGAVLFEAAELTLLLLLFALLLLLLLLLLFPVAAVCLCTRGRGFDCLV